MKKITTLLIGFMLFSTAMAKTEILFNIFLPPQHFIAKVFRDWGKDVEKVTEKRVTVKFPAKSLAPPPEQYKGVVGGVFDGAFSFNGFIANQVTFAQFASVPLVYSGDSVKISQVYWRTYQKFFADSDEYGKAHLLSLFYFAGSSFCSLTDKPILSVKDMQSRKMWALAGFDAALMKSLDVSIVSGPAFGIHEYVSRNVVEGFTGITNNSIEQFKAAPYTKSCTATAKRPFASAFSMFINKDKWNSISAKDRKAIMSVSGEKVATAVGKAVNTGEIKAKKKMEKRGIKFYKADAKFTAEINKALEPFTENWIKKANAKGANGAEVIRYFRSQLD